MPNQAISDLFTANPITSPGDDDLVEIGGVTSGAIRFADLKAAVLAVLGSLNSESLLQAALSEKARAYHIYTFQSGGGTPSGANTFTTNSDYSSFATSIQIGATSNGDQPIFSALKTASKLNFIERATGFVYSFTVNGTWADLGSSIFQVAILPTVNNAELTGTYELRVDFYGDFATSAQGALADTALQDASAFATAAQGAKADSAIQPGGTGLISADSGWTANGDAGDKTQSIGSSAALSSFQSPLNFLVPGFGDAFIIVAEKTKALETAGVAALRPNA